MLLQLNEGDHRVLVDTRGAWITQWQYKEVDILFPQQEILINGEKKIRGGMFPCVPNFGPPPTKGSLKNLPQHGFIRNTEFQESHSSEGINLSCLHKGDDLFPYDFEIYVSLNILRNMLGYTISAFTDSNNHGSTREIPFCIGLHPYFNTPKGLMTAYNEKPTTEVLPHEAEERSFSLPTKILAYGTFQAELEVQGFDRAVYWTDAKEYFCIEPISGDFKKLGKPDGPNIEPKQMKSQSLIITVSEAQTK